MVACADRWHRLSLTCGLCAAALLACLVLQLAPWLAVAVSAGPRGRLFRAEVAGDRGARYVEAARWLHGERAVTYWQPADLPEEERASRRRLAQYHLAPVLLDPDGEHARGLADLATAAAVRGIAREDRWRVIRDLGDGVAVLERVQP